jgi:hypothetical protein
MRQRPVAAVALGAALVLAAACGPGTSEGLTDPRDILARTVRESATVRSVTLAAELRMRDARNPGVSGGSIDAQMDLAAMELNAGIVDQDGRELGRVIITDGALYTTTSNGRWTEMPFEEGMLNPSVLLMGGGLGNGPDYFAILTAAASDPAIGIGLTGVEDCAAGRCYRTTIQIPPNAVWPLLVRMTGLDQVPGMQPPAPDASQLPLVTLSVLTDTASLRLVELTGGGSLQGATVEVAIRLSNHDAPVSITAPPANLIDQGFGGEFGGEFGGGFGPVGPAPMEPEPSPIDAPVGESPPAEPAP